MARLANKHYLVFTLVTLVPIVANGASLSSLKPNITASKATENIETQATRLNPIIIEAPSFKGDMSINDFEPISSVSQSSLDRYQAEDIYEAIDNIAGVSSLGGPRTHSRNISIRGFANNEDILVQVDGASQNFEKYRFGSGIILEPELLKTISVHKGSPSAALGSGTIGGAIIVETKDAFDFLQQDKIAGARYKLGYNSNDSGNLSSLNLFGKPMANLGILAHTTQRESGNKELANGDFFPESDESQTSSLIKLTWQESYSSLSIAYRGADESGEEPFDASAGPNGIGGLVNRSTRERSPTLNYTFNHGNLVNLKTSFGNTNKTIIDEGGSFFENAVGTFDYETDDANIANTSLFEWNNTSFNITYGIQSHHQNRVVTRKDNTTGITSPYESQPSGQREYNALYLQNELFIGNFSLGFGIRKDDYKTKSLGLATNILNQQGRPNNNQFNLETRNASLAYVIGQALIFYRYKEAFRVPLTDESYALGITSNCQSFNFFTDQPSPPNFNDYRAEFPNILDALDSFNQELSEFEKDLIDFTQSPFARTNAVCGNLYRPELSGTQELGFSLNSNNIFSTADSLVIKLLYFNTNVTQLLNSIYQDSVTGVITQQGIENSKGYELEISYDSLNYFVNLAFDTFNGFQNLRYFNNNIDTRVLNNPENMGRQDLFNKAPAKAAVSFGKKHKLIRLAYGYTYERFSSRRVSTGFRTDNGCQDAGFGNPACLTFGTEPTYTLHSLFLEWQPTEHTKLNISIDNATNEEYNFIDTFGGTGFIGTGRDIRIAFSQEF